MKYNIEARGREGLDNTWSLEDLDSGEIILTNHVEIKVAISTLEKQIEGKGFGMIVDNAKIEHRDHPKIGKFVILVKE